MIKKYGKSYGDIIDIKKDMYAENDEYLARVQRSGRIYKEQPVREICKVCETKLDKKTIRSFVSHDIKYYICPVCGHINGECQETHDFTTRIYMDGKESNNAVYYTEQTKEGYENRINKIYIPKVEFMKECLEKENIDYTKCDFLDVGAGSGYFVSAMDRLGLNAKGIEISKEQVTFGNRMIGKDLLEFMDEDSVTERVRNAREVVLSFIGVFEHVLNLTEILRILSDNQNIRYVYFSVPIFAMSVMWEAITPEIYNRHLGNGHTHMFSLDSLNYIYEKYGWDIVGQWNFGTDMGDLYRTLYVKLQKEGNIDLSEILRERFLPVLDDMQLVLDKKGMFSQVHVLIKKRHR